MDIHGIVSKIKNSTISEEDILKFSKKKKEPETPPEIQEINEEDILRSGEIKDKSKKLESKRSAPVLEREEDVFSVLGKKKKEITDADEKSVAKKKIVSNAFIKGFAKDLGCMVATEVLGSDVAHWYSFDCAPLDIVLGGGIPSGKVVECLTGDTEIPLLDGRVLLIRDLVGLEEFWVYSCTSEGKIVPGRGHSARITKEVIELVEVVLDTGEIVRCTPDHLFMLRDGLYKEAGYLEEGDSLMPFYSKIRIREGTSRLFVKDNYLNKLIPAHRIIKSYFEEIPFRLGVHHDNRDSLDNSPKNLVILTKSEHRSEHNKDLWSKESYKAKMRTVMSNNAINLFNDPEYKDWFVKMRREDQNRRSQEGTHNFQNLEIIEMVKKRAEERNNKIINFNCPICGRFFEKQASYFSHKKYCGASEATILEYKKTLKEAQNKYQQKKRDEKRESVQYNHKVYKVNKIRLDNPVFVYDISVDKFHNFALKSGVFVHNCFGWESSGKSTIVLEASKAFTKYWSSRNDDNYVVLWLESESALDKVRAQYMGCDLSRFVIQEADTAEDGFKTIKHALEKATENGLKVLIVWDTIAAVLTDSEKATGEWNTKGMGEKARLIRLLLKDVNKLLGKTDSTLIFVNQMYKTFALYGEKDEVPGGGGIKFHASIRALMKRVGPPIEVVLPDGNKMTKGIEVDLYTKKNKLTLPYQTCKLVIYGESGIDIVETLVKFLTLHKYIVTRGGWKYIEFKGEDYRFQNIDQLKEILEVKCPELKVYMNYLCYSFMSTVSPLLKVKLLGKLWDFELQLYGEKKTKITDEEFTLATLLGRELLEEQDRII